MREPIQLINDQKLARLFSLDLLHRATNVLVTREPDVVRFGFRVGTEEHDLAVRRLLDGFRVRIQVFLDHATVLDKPLDELHLQGLPLQWIRSWWTEAERQMELRLEQQIAEKRERADFTLDHLLENL